MNRTRGEAIGPEGMERHRGTAALQTMTKVNLVQIVQRSPKM